MPHDTIYELRDYTLRPGQRDTLIALFEREFIEPQEALGAHVRATFRDLDNPDRFVWIRGFADAVARFNALDGFYSGPVWQTHRTAAIATMVDSDNVLQLRQIGGSIPTVQRPPVGAAEVPTALILATTYFPKSEAAFADHFVHEVSAHLRELDAAPFATFVTDHAPNAYPRLPVRDDTVFLTLTRFETADQHAQRQDAVDALEHTIAPLLAAPTQYRRLQPTARSALR